MSPSKIPPQATFFSSHGPFSAEMDTTFLQSLVNMKKRGGWTTTDIPDDALQAARLIVNHHHNCLITMEDVVNRKHFMQLRYMTFKELANNKRAKYDPSTNMVNPEEKIWKKIFKKNAFAQAYRFQGEPEFPILCFLFGADDVKEELTHTQTINISSTSLPRNEANKIVVLSDDEEISSPNLMTSRRRLFDDVSSTGDRHSTNDNALSDRPLFPPRNAFPPRYMGCSSSCASSSPSKFNWGSFR